MEWHQEHIDAMSRMVAIGLCPFPSLLRPTPHLIDDEEQVRMMFKVALEKAGYGVLTAENGKHALRLLEHQEMDLILIDLVMPDMD